VRRTAWLVLVATLLLWSGNWIVARAVRDAIAPGLATVGRLLIVLAILLPFAFSNLKAKLPELRSRDWKIIAALGFTGGGVHLGLQWLGLHYTTATSGILYLSTTPLFIMLMSVPLGERVGARQWLGVVVSFCGVFLIATRGAKSILEIGGASGYSGIWLGLGARESGGRVVSIEYDPQRAKEASANIRMAGLTDVVQVIHGDAFKEIPKLPGSFDFVFLDAWKPDYKKFFDMVFPRLTPGGLFTAHNVVNKKSEMEPFLATVQKHTGLFTTIVSPSSEGISVSYKIK